MYHGQSPPIPRAVAHAVRGHRPWRTIGWALPLAAVSLFLFSWFLLSGMRPDVALALGLLSVVTAWLVFLTGYQAMASARGGAAVLLGIVFLGVGLLEFFALVAESGFGEKMSADASRQQGLFRLVASGVASLGLLAYVALPPTAMPGAWHRYGAVGLVLGFAALVGYAGFVQPDWARIFLAGIQNNIGPDSGWARGVIMTNGVALAGLWFRRRQLADESRTALVLSLLLLAASSYFGLLHDGAPTDALGSLYRVTAYASLLQAIRATALHRPMVQLGRQAQRERAVIKAAPDGVLMVDEGGRILLASPAMEQLSGYRPSELVGQTVDIFLPPSLREKHADLMRGYFLQPSLRPMGAVANNLQLHRRDGTGIPIDIALGQWHEGGRPYAVAFIRDISEHKRQDERLRYQATHDELTGLSNRWLFRHHLDRALVRAGRSGRRVALLFLDLDHFKVVNDSFGHACGDALLMQVARRLSSSLRESDTLARFGGDEFAILLADLESTEEAIRVAGKLLSMFAAPYRVQEQEVYSGGSLGVAFYPDDAKDGDALLHCADMAMYQAKQAGRGSYACYSERLGQRMREDLAKRRAGSPAKARLPLGF